MAQEPIEEPLLIDVLEEARKAKGAKNLDELAQMLGITDRLMDKYKAGDAAPRYNRTLLLLRLGGYLRESTEPAVPRDARIRVRDELIGLRDLVDRIVESLDPPPQDDAPDEED